MAYTDPLTQTNKRASFNDFIEREWRLDVPDTKSQTNRWLLNRE